MIQLQISTLLSKLASSYANHLLSLSFERQVSYHGKDHHHMVIVDPHWKPVQPSH